MPKEAPTRYPTRDERQTLCSERHYYTAHFPNGEVRPAQVTGYDKDFAQLHVQGMGGSIEYAWPTVARIAAKGGQFKVDPQHW